MTPDHADEVARMVAAAATPLECAVAAIVEDEAAGYPGWVDDLLAHGCESGMVSALVYYHQTAAFYEAHEDEIMAVCDGVYSSAELEALGAKPIHAIMNARAWLAFELVVGDLKTRP